MNILVRYILFFAVLISSCTRTETKQWSIPLHSADANLEIDLPRELKSIKESVHTSDCKPCGKYHTVLAGADFMERIEDTTGFFSPWLSDTTPTSIFYIEEQLYPESYPDKGNRDFQEELKPLIDRLKIEDPQTKVLEQATGIDRAMIRYETFGKNGTLKSKRIECLTFVDDRIIEIHYVQYHDLQNELIENVWTGLREMNIEKKK
jgi:hypothetical protein